MTDDDRSQALRRLLDHLGQNLKGMAEKSDAQRERDEFLANATEMAEKQGGIVVPMPVDMSDMDPDYARIMQGLTDEQAKASLFFGQLPKDHPYKILFKKLGEIWGNAAVIGAVKIAEHEKERHEGEGQIGPREYSTAWAAIGITAVLGAVRHGQEHPDAFKGLEGVQEGEIDETVTKLIDWAAEEVAKAREQEEPDKES